jgi:hypothetical protein
LLQRSPQDFLRPYDSKLKQAFAWYATLEETDPQRTTWESVRQRGGTVGRTQLMLMLLHFQARILGGQHLLILFFGENDSLGVPRAHSPPQI